MCTWRREVVLWRAVVSLFAVFSGCYADSAGAGASAGGGDDQSGKTDRWNEQNNPEWLKRSTGLDLVYDYKGLKPYQQVNKVYLSDKNIPWPDTYWPSSDDNVNARWNLEAALSPAEMYDALFHSWNPSGKNPDDAGYFEALGPFAREVHTIYGTGQCRDIQSWEGICHAWTASSLNEPEPLNWVKVGEHTLYSSDIKALMDINYSHAPSTFIGFRCSSSDVSGGTASAACKDANAGAFHLVVTNRIGKERLPLAEDRVASEQVWNQPVVGYKIVDSRSATRQEAEAAAQSGGERVSADADGFAYIAIVLYYFTEGDPQKAPFEVDKCLKNIGNRDPMDCGYVRGDNYSYFLELKSGRIIGGVWVPTDGYGQPHPDFLWWPNSRGTVFKTIKYDNVKCLLTASRTGQVSDCLRAIGTRLGVEVSVGTEFQSPTPPPPPGADGSATGRDVQGSGFGDSCELFSSLIAGCPSVCVMQYVNCLQVQAGGGSRPGASALAACGSLYESCIDGFAVAADADMKARCTTSDHSRVPCSAESSVGFCVPSGQCSASIDAAGVCPAGGGNVCCVSGGF